MSRRPKVSSCLVNRVARSVARLIWIRSARRPTSSSPVGSGESRVSMAISL
jgi:hypothetical protein